MRITHEHNNKNHSYTHGHTEEKQNLYYPPESLAAELIPGKTEIFFYYFIHSFQFLRQGLEPSQ